MIAITPLTGEGVTKALPALAQLRLDVFRAWPYLYDGTLASEQDYIQQFSQASDAVIVAAFDGDTIIGAATGAPLLEHTKAFAPLFSAHGYDPAHTFYCGESVLLPAYRGQGIGHRFFDEREAHAQRLQGPTGRYTTSAFCGVIRSPDDPRCPPNYRPLDPFWRKRGYAPISGLVGTYDWREVDRTDESTHQMQFWARTLPATP